MKLQLQAFGDLVSRYGQIFRAAWVVRDQLDSPRRTSHELAFLPAHLELVDTPIHPAPKWAMRFIIALAGLTLIWAIFGQLDIVAVAPGKITPSGNVKTIQPLEAALVKRIAVTDGQHVTQGQLLIELDATQAGADDRKARDALIDASLAEARGQAILRALEQRSQVSLSRIPDVDAIRLQAEQALADSQLHELRSKLAAIEAEVAKREAELQTSNEVIEKLRQTLPIVQKRAEDFKNLLAENFVSQHGYLEKEQDRIEKTKDLAAAKSRARESQHAIVEQKELLKQTLAEFRHQQLDQLNQAQQRMSQLKQEAVKTSQRDQQMRLSAPVTGTVQQLAIHTVGGVVTPAQALMIIVPDNPSLEVNALISNQDIGFVDKGQDAIVKIETFPFTRYGYLTGKVTTVSSDAIQDEKKGLVFDATVMLEQSKLKVENKWVNLTPGMAVTVEVKTGKRSVMEYFLSPLRQNVQESLRER